MAKGISLHIGLNEVDPTHYSGWNGALSACEFDANDMASLAKKQGFVESSIVLTKEATAAAVAERIQNAAKNSPKEICFC